MRVIVDGQLQGSRLQLAVGANAGTVQQTSGARARQVGNVAAPPAGIPSIALCQLAQQCRV